MKESQAYMRIMLDLLLIPAHFKLQIAYSGCTRLTLEALGSYWGFYFYFITSLTCGSPDLIEAGSFIKQDTKAQDTEDSDRRRRLYDKYTLAIICVRMSSLPSVLRIIYKL